MARTSDQRDPFRRRLRALRDGAGLSQKQVVDQLEANGGTFVTPQMLGQYEKGDAAPSRENAIALGKILGDEGLPELLGYHGPDPGVYERLDRLESRLSRIEELFDAMGDEMRRIREAAEGLEGR